MSKAAFTIKAFGVYLLCLGIIVTFAPNQLLSILGIPQTKDVWIRVTGVLVINIGIYYWYAARCEATAFFHASVYTRSLILVSFASFAVFGLVSPIIILFGAVDFLGGLWPYHALRLDKQRGDVER